MILANPTQSAPSHSAKSAPVAAAPPVRAPVHARSVESLMARQNWLSKGFDVTLILILLSLIGHVILGAGVDYSERTQARRLTPPPEAIPVE
ncbi:MAG: hypothetical protein EBY21_11320, partial [Alphaproteobacteria bacterium]|nr:hypothetical protein [Alphaproteobacteria bacterium]